MFDPLVISFLGMILSLIGFCVALVIWYNQKNQSDEIHQAVGYIKTQTENNEIIKKRVETQLARELRGFCQVLLSQITNLQHIQYQIVQRNNNFSKEAREETEFLRQNFQEGVKQFEKTIETSKFLTQSNIMIENFEGQLHDVFMRLTVTGLYQNESLIMDRDFSTYREHCLDESELLVDELYSDVKPYLPQKDQKELFRIRRTNQTN